VRPAESPGCVTCPCTFQGEFDIFRGEYEIFRREYETVQRKYENFQVRNAIYSG
jgi:hypothetical protein